ncbi:acyltransferase family protein [Aliiroseovarius crassostreae]|uniref:acyltransferase family protein n=1 Tax=Aliiroseovarius crassostreae TaxID=154981 RepID=UPI003C7BE9AB
MQAKNQTQFVSSIHLLRAYAACAVVLFHCGVVIGLDKYQADPVVARMTHGLAAGVDLFFVISGFVISLPFFWGRRQRPLRFLKQRALRIYPMSLIVSALFLALGFAVYGRVPTLDGLASSLLLLPSATPPTPVVLWTLKQELLFYGLFLLVILFGRVGLVGIGGWALASLWVAGDGVWTKWLLHPQNVQFAFGILAAWSFVRFDLRTNLARLVLLVSAVGFVVAAHVLRQSEGAAQMEAIVLAVVGYLVVISAAFSQLRLSRLAMFLGTASYSIYLVHFLFVSFGNKVLFRLFPDLDGMLALLLLAGFALVMSALFYYLIERPIEAWRKARRRAASDLRPVQV